jgi:hypothetical protein
MASAIGLPSAVVTPARTIGAGAGERCATPTATNAQRSHRTIPVDVTKQGAYPQKAVWSTALARWYLGLRRRLGAA